MVMVVADIAGLKAQSSSQQVVIIAATPNLNGIFFYTPDNFVGKDDDVTIVKAFDKGLNEGAWVRQGARSFRSNVSFPDATVPGTYDDGPNRVAHEKLNDVVSVRDNLASGLSVASDKSKIQELSDRIIYSKTVHVPVGQYKFVRGGLIQSRSHDWCFETAGLFRGDYKANQFEDLCLIKITDTDSEPEVRNPYVFGGRWLTFNEDAGDSNAPDYDSKQLAAGGWAIRVEAVDPGKNVIGMRFSQTSITGGLGAIRFIGTNEDRTVAWSGIDKSTITNGVLCEATADGFMFRDNVATGIKPAYTYDILLGAFCYTVDGGTTSNWRGALDVKNASMWRLTNVQIEHSDDYIQPEKAEASVMIRGETYPSFLGIIDKCNFGGGVGRVNNNIHLKNARATVIDANYFFLSDENDILIESAAHQTIVGTRNLGRGELRPRRGTGQYTDASRRLRIAMPAGMRVATERAAVAASGTPATTSC